jgi:hypothetical protein
MPTFILVIGALAIAVAACGRDDEHGSDASPQSHDEGAPAPFDPEQPYLIRAQWVVPLGGGAQTTLAPPSESQAIGGQVSPSVSFALSNANFVTPEAVGIASYGSLDVTELRDNALRVCGTSGDQMCAAAHIRIYTTGTPMPGLYSDSEGYGAPILTGAQTIGLGPAGAATLASVAIGAKRVLKLSDFTAVTPLLVPVAVDFSSAPAGTYRSTLVVEYVLQ